MHPHVIEADQCFLLVVDLQQSYAPVLHEWDRTIERASLLIRAARELELPVLFTEQYPKGVGPTTPRVREVLGDAPGFEKSTLSCLGAPGLLEHLGTLARGQAIVCGIETHACINQTTHDLLGRGFQVHLPEDALSARTRSDHDSAYRKMLASGAIASSVEMALLEVLRTSEHPKFKAVHALIK